MQTFLPFEDFAQSAQCLDRQRLGKQRVETLQIMTALIEGRGWISHPAVRMWENCEVSLMRYQDAICDEWEARGYKDTCREKTRRILECSQYFQRDWKPLWLGRADFHFSHQSNLLRKDYDWYIKFFPNMVDDLPYIWPVTT